jgi:glycyl-tRNA synthetase beta chain
MDAMLMPDLLLELFSEEIPARMQHHAADFLKKNITNMLVDLGLTYEGAISFVTPRRLTLHIAGLPPASPDVQEERKGPRVDAPEKALQGFMRGAGLQSLDQADIRHDPKKGDYYTITLMKTGKPTAELLKDTIEDTIRHFVWPKAMRWGAGRLKWVRPLHSILCTFGPETEEPEIIPVKVDHITASNVTYGHRFMAPEPIIVRRLEDYAKSLQEADVVLDHERRKDIIVHDARNLAFAKGLDWVEDTHLLDEVAGLVEYPVVLMGHFDEAFLNIPDAVIQAAIRLHQKCFVVRQQGASALAPYFILVSNIKAHDGGKAIIAGNERVVAARLSDAQFFWNSDLATPLKSMAGKLDAITFHAKLGTQGDRVRRIQGLSAKLARITKANADLCIEAAELCKADLVSQMVGEFPELQGLMGKVYALKQGYDPQIANAIDMHYKPVGPSDEVPCEPVAITVALADKLDILAGFWAIDETPTGSKDPFALRRAALGVIRMILENDLSMDLAEAVTMALKPYQDQMNLSSDQVTDTQQALLKFFIERLKTQLRNQGLRHDLVDAVFALPDQHDLLRLVQRVKALQDFLTIDDGASLLAGYKRAANILAKDNPKYGVSDQNSVDPELFATTQEKALYQHLQKVQAQLQDLLSRHDFTLAMVCLSELRQPVDALFEHVMINDDNDAIRANRLNLLMTMIAIMGQIADFSKVEG